MIKMINIDIDGTLCDKFGVVSKRNREAIKMAREKGAYVVVTTGRPLKSSLEISKDIGASNYIICSNGALIYDEEKRKVIDQKFIPRDIVFKIIDICENNSIYYSLYTVETILTKKLKYNTLVYNRENIYKDISKRTNINIVEDVKKYIIEKGINNVTKFSICDENINVFKNCCEKIRKIESLTVLDPAWMSRRVIKYGTDEINLEYYVSEITLKEATKKEGVKKLAQILGINRENIMAIGDNMNDEAMIEYAGVGVAMKNAFDRIKEKAQFVTEDNNSDGVAIAIEKYVGGN